MPDLTPITVHSDQLEVRILPLGASLVGVRFAGQTRNLVLGFANPSDHATCPVFAGPLVGPVANRMRDGLVEIEGISYHMPLNEAGRTTLHSGPDGLHAQLWTLVRQTPQSVTLQCDLPDGFGGLPGNRQFEASYEVTGTTLSLSIKARTDATTAINIAAHPYWNLDGRDDISEHRLEIHADSYLPVDSHNLPTGHQAPVAGTIFDFRSGKPVPLDPALDTNFCLKDSMQLAPHPAATLKGADGTTLQIATNATGLQVYNGSGLPTDAPPTADFPTLRPYAAIALEPQHWPDAMTHRHFPVILTRPGETYHQITQYTFSRS